MKFFLFAAALAFSAPSMASDYIPVAEVCIDQGPCAFRIPFPGLEQQGVYIVTAEDAIAIRDALPGKHLFLATSEEYTAAKGQFKGAFEEITIDAPFLSIDSRVIMRTGGPTAAPAPKPTPSGPLIGGSITIGDITIGSGDSGCIRCHGASPHRPKEGSSK